MTVNKRDGDDNDSSDEPIEAGGCIPRRRKTADRGGLLFEV